jgi:hypothetical protein
VEVPKLRPRAIASWQIRQSLEKAVELTQRFQWSAGKVSTVAVIHSIGESPNSVLVFLVAPALRLGGLALTAVSMAIRRFQLTASTPLLG